jgi:diguanylate cyclase (GGDEF)-like protein
MSKTLRRQFWELFQESNIRFRHKVMLGVGLSLFVAGLAGANAIYNVRKVGESVDFSSKAASPLLVGVMSLSENYQKLQSAFDPVIKNCSGITDAGQALANSVIHQNRQLAAIADLAAKSGATAQLARYELVGRKIFRTRRDLLEICRRSAEWSGKMTIAETYIRGSTGYINQEAAAGIAALEGRFNAIWRAGNGMPPTSDTRFFGSISLASADSSMLWGALRNFYRIKVFNTELTTASTLLTGLSGRARIEDLRASFENKTVVFENAIAELGAFYVASGREAELERISRMAAITHGRLLGGPDSLFNSYAALDALEQNKQALVQGLKREQGQYLITLLDIVDTAQNINRDAQRRTEVIASAASWEIAAGVIAGAILAFCIGWYFKIAVTKPLEALSANIGGLDDKDGGGAHFVDQRLLDRRDEIGDLAQEFDRTFGALASARQALQESSRAEISLQRDRLHGAIENIPQGLYMLDREGRIIVANQKLARIYDLESSTALLGLKVDEFTATCHAGGAGIRRLISDHAVPEDDDTGGCETTQRIVELEDGRFMTVTSMQLPDGGYVVTHEDITEQQATSEKIAHLALHDGLTGLANRILFRDHIGWQTETDGAGSASALLFLDLDRFKIVNDTLGHPVGDALLVEVAGRLRRCLGEGCFAARLGGDEFAVYQTGVAQPQGAEMLATDIIRRISEPFEIDGHHIIIGTSVGIALVPEDGRDADELLKNADLALYCAKQEGRGQYRFFAAGMDERMRAWHEMERDLRAAIAGNQFELYYQPLVSMQDGAIVGFEALIRWHHPRHGFVSPADFIPVAEETGLINEIGVWILETACEMARLWPAEVGVAVNISPVQFSAQALDLKVMSALGRSGLEPGRLMLEITEGVFLNDTEQTLAILNRIKNAGVHIALDDFGTGYSSLSYLRKFRFDKIKIDQGFVRGAKTNPESIAIIRAVTGLCQDLGMTATAEGVEDQEQSLILKDLGCSIAQGYFYGRPMPAAETLALFDGRRRLSA